MSAPRRPVSFLTSATMSPVAWLMVSSAPSARAAASFASVDAVAITRAPQSFAIWIAAVPTPEPPAITSTVSPCWIAARSTSICQAVRNTVGIAASCASSRATRARGAGTRLAAGHDDILGLPAVRLLAQHLPVGTEVVAPGEAGGAAAARQARVDDDAIALGQIRHRLHARADRRDDAADVAARDVRKRDLQRGQPLPQPQIDVVHRRRRDTRTCTSPGPGVGVGTSPTSMTSGPPCRRNSAARMAARG